MVWKRVGCCHIKRWPSVTTWEGWPHWRGEGCSAWVVTGQWSTTPRNPSLRHPSRHPARVHRQCWIIQCELRAFVLFLELFVLIGNRPIIGRLFGIVRPVHYRCIPNLNPNPDPNHARALNLPTIRVSLCLPVVVRHHKNDDQRTAPSWHYFRHFVTVSRVYSQLGCLLCTRLAKCIDISYHQPSPYWQ